MAKTLFHLLQALPSAQIIGIPGNTDVPVTAPVVESDSDISPGGVFVARSGLSVDGHRFIPQAIASGAVAVVGEREITDCAVPYARVKNAQAIIGLLAAAYHDFPSRKLTVIGITGTDGKTTTSHLIHSILKLATGDRAGFISTIAADFGGRSASTGLHVTTPGAPRVQEYLAQMVDAGVTHCILEMTSHGLAQGRLNGVDLDAAVLTNVTHEHLDYHGSWENYRLAKARMFEMLSRSYRKPGRPKVSVINADDPSHEFFAAIPADKTISYGLLNDADYRAANIRYDPDRTSFDVGSENFSLQLVGEFNVYNALAALALARGMALPFPLVREGLARVAGVSGRMERIDEGQDFGVIVDFAHTPNALKRALEAGKAMLRGEGRLIAVFGSAGLRDVEKRRMMAAVAAQLADMTILTAEDPRTESLDDILRAMAASCVAQGGVEGESFMRIPDRGEAIYRACQMARAGDLVMICGKGHEQSMCFGATEYPWDDREATRSALRGEPLRALPTARGLI